MFKILHLQPFEASTENRQNVLEVKSCFFFVLKIFLLQFVQITESCEVKRLITSLSSFALKNLKIQTGAEVGGGGGALGVWLIFTLKKINYPQTEGKCHAFGGFVSSYFRVVGNYLGYICTG